MKLLITGDYCPIGRYESQMVKAPEEVLGGFTQTIQNADIAITNLECPITNSKKHINKTGPALKTNEDALLFLKNAGFNYVTLANNHIMDYDTQGLADTISALKKHKIKYVGAGGNYEQASEIFFFEKDGIKIAILNFAENEWSTTMNEHSGANPINPVRNFALIQKAKSKADQVIVVTHGGHEMYKLPSPRMKELFRFYIDAGANAVVNHHTHCVSGYEIYNKAPIFYSLGNFLFDHTSYKNTIWNEGMALTLNINKENILFEIHHFSQANEQAILRLCDEKESNKRDQNLNELNTIIQDDVLLKKEFDVWVLSQKKMFKAFIEPHTLKILSALQVRGFLPSLWKKRKKMFLLNLIRCEAHQDILVSILKDEISHT